MVIGECCGIDPDVTASVIRGHEAVGHAQVSPLSDESSGQIKIKTRGWLISPRVRPLDLLQPWALSDRIYVQCRETLSSSKNSRRERRGSETARVLTASTIRKIS